MASTQTLGRYKRSATWRRKLRIALPTVWPRQALNTAICPISPLGLMLPVPTTSPSQADFVDKHTVTHLGNFGLIFVPLGKVKSKAGFRHRGKATTTNWISMTALPIVIDAAPGCAIYSLSILLIRSLSIYLIHQAKPINRNTSITKA